MMMINKKPKPIRKTRVVNYRKTQAIKIIETIEDRRDLDRPSRWPAPWARRQKPVRN